MVTSLNRRSLLVASSLAGASAVSLSLRQGVLAQEGTPIPPAVPEGPFTLPALPYAYEALEPHIDTLTMQIHHDKHHAAYVNNLNTALADHADLQAMTIEELITGLDALPEEIRTAVRNNGGGHYNHSMFWELMSPTPVAPSGDLAAAIDRDLGGLEALQTAVNEAGVKRFGSGWSWVVANGGTLSVVSTPNQDSPLMDGSGTPILGVDVWEHAYYLKYQNKRADYLAAWWNILNWDAVAARYGAAS
jgi:Fe-Mn family superoxide dismutase